MKKVEKEDKGRRQKRKERKCKNKIKYNEKVKRNE